MNALTKQDIERLVASGMISFPPPPPPPPPKRDKAPTRPPKRDKAPTPKPPKVKPLPSDEVTEGSTIGSRVERAKRVVALVKAHWSPASALRACGWPSSYAAGVMACITQKGPIWEAGKSGDRRQIPKNFNSCAASFVEAWLGMEEHPTKSADDALMRQVVDAVMAALPGFGSYGRVSVQLGYDRNYLAALAGGRDRVSITRARLLITQLADLEARRKGQEASGR